ncbi:MAG: anti-sigma factor family protein [Chitinophagales bacterium]
MNCERVRNLLSAYLDRELGTEEFRVVRAHLVTCAECSAELEAERALKDALAGLPSAEVPDGFLEGLMARLDGEPAPSATTPAKVIPLRRYGWLAAGAVAALFLVVFPLVRQMVPTVQVIEAQSFYRQHSLVNAAQPLADRALESYYYAVAGDADRRSTPVADRVKLVGQFSE